MYSRSLYQLANKYQAQQCFSSDEDSEEGFKPPGLSKASRQAQFSSDGQNSTLSDSQMASQQQCNQDFGSKLLHRFTSEETRDDESLSKAETETLVKLLKVYNTSGTNEELCVQEIKCVSQSYERQSSLKSCPSQNNQNQQQTIWRQSSAEEAQPNFQQTTGGKNGFLSALFITPPKVDHNVASSQQNQNASAQSGGINEKEMCDTLGNSDRISVSPFENTKYLPNAEARQALHFTEKVKVREPFTDTFADNKSSYQAPKEWIVKKDQDLNLKSATSGIIDEKLGSAVPTTTASSNSLFKNSSGPALFKRASNSQNLSAINNNVSQEQACESAPHQFLGKDLVSLLDSCQSPLKEITDFDATTKKRQESTQPSLQSFQLNKITIGNPIQAQSKAVEEKADSTFAFPDGGWVCSCCQNYNFSGRNKCNRCQKQKAKNDFVGKPKHLLRQQRQVEQKSQVTKPDQTNGKQKVQAPTSAPVATNLGQGKENKLNEERVGDWVCMKCTNLNFSFRMTCNRCFRDRTAGASVIKNQDELQKFQSAGCPAQYIRTHTSGLNSQAASFKPCLSDQACKVNLPAAAKIIGAMSVQDRSQVESILRRLSNQSEVSQSGGNEPDAEQEEQLNSE